VHRLRAMRVPRALTTALRGDDARRLTRRAAMDVARALDALTIEVARRAHRVCAAVVRGAFDAEARGEVAEGLLGIAVGWTRTRQTTAATRDVTRALVAVRVLETVDAARISLVAHAARAVARTDTLDARASGDLAARPVRRTVAVVEALHAATAALTGRVAQLGAIDIGQALHAQVELARAATRRLARAVAGLRAGQRAGGQHAVAALVARAVDRRAALDTGVAHARRFAAAAVRVHEALPAGTASAERTLARAVPARAALDARADTGKQLERAPLIKIAAAGSEAEPEPGAQRDQQRSVEAGHHGDGGERTSIRCSASCRAKPPG
jgi:hypothetical protein